MDAFTELLHGWQNFYFMIGGAAATLIGLMFVAMSMATHLISEQRKQEFNIFVTPSVFYFVIILMTAGVMLVPTYSPTGLAVALSLDGLFGLIHATRASWRLAQVAKEQSDFLWWEWMSQIVLPVVAFVLILLAALGLLADSAVAALMGLAAGVLLLLLGAIGNTWSLVIWIIDQRSV